MGSDSTRAAMARLWEVQRPDGAWDWLNFGLEPYEANDSVFYGATLAALAAGTSPGRNAARRPRPGGARAAARLPEDEPGVAATLQSRLGAAGGVATARSA